MNDQINNRVFRIPNEVAQGSARTALNEMERRLGVKIIPEIKGALCKHLTGILAKLELTGTQLTHEGMEKQLAHLAGIERIEKPKKTMGRKRWK